MLRHVTRSDIRQYLLESIYTSGFEDRVYLAILDFLHTEVFKFENFMNIRIKPNDARWDDGRYYNEFNAKLGAVVGKFFMVGKYKSDPATLSRIPKRVIDAYEVNKALGGLVFILDYRKTNTIVDKFKQIIGLPTKRLDNENIKTSLAKMFAPNGKPLTLIVLPSSFHTTQGGAGFADANVVYLKSKITGTLTLDDEVDLPESASEAFAEIIKRRTKLVLDHEFTHVIDDLSGIHSHLKDEYQKKRQAAFPKDPSDLKQKEEYMRIYASEYHEINARLITAFRFFKNQQFVRMYNDIVNDMTNPQVWAQNWKPISSEDMFLAYYKDNLSEYAMKDKRRYYQFLNTPELVNHFEQRIKSFYKSEIRSTSQWRYLERKFNDFTQQERQQILG